MHTQNEECTHRVHAQRMHAQSARIENARIEYIQNARIEGTHRGSKAPDFDMRDSMRAQNTYRMHALNARIECTHRRHAPDFDIGEFNCLLRYATGIRRLRQARIEFVLFEQARIEFTRSTNTRIELLCTPAQIIRYRHSFFFLVRLAVSVTVALAISVRMSTSVGYSSYRLANARAYSRRLHHYSTHMCVRRKECVGGGGVGVSVRDFKKKICMYVRTYACVFWSIYTCQFVCV